MAKAPKQQNYRVIWDGAFSYIAATGRLRPSKQDDIYETLGEAKRVLIEYLQHERRAFSDATAQIKALKIEDLEGL